MRKFVVGCVSSVVLSCGVFGASSEDEGAPAGPPPSVAPPGAPAPQLDGTPTEDQITESYGVFVAPAGPPDADGTREKPYATLAAGLARAVADRKVLYVCAGTFPEAVKVERGISMIGGLDCSRREWKPSGAPTKLTAPSSPAMIAEDVDLATRIEAFEIVAPDGTDAAPSSIGVRAVRAPGVLFVGSKIVAGKAKDGADGADGPQLTLGASAKGGDGLTEQKPSPGAVLTLLHREGSAGGVGACTGAAGIAPGTAGGKGGYGGTYDSEYRPATQFALAGYYWKDYCRPAGGAVPCVKDWTPAAGVGGPAAPGSDGTDGASATARGTLNADGYTPSNGTAGTNGGAGTGGKGGAGGAMASSYAGGSQLYGYGATGPGGGAGGCPGLAGAPGKGGGASIGLLMMESKGLTLDATTVTAGDGGKGGKGSFGSSPTPGGAAGAVSGAATPASAGGAGGRSGIGGSGSGGPSYGIAATKGDATLVNGATAKAGLGGAGVEELTAADALGNAKTIPASVGGDAKDQISF